MTDWSRAVPSREAARRLAKRALDATPAPVQGAARKGLAAMRARRPVGGPVPAPQQPDTLAPPEGATPASDPTVPTQEAPLWRSPDVPLPEGYTLASIEAVFRSWSVDGEPVGHLHAYVNDSLLRFLHTWAMARDDTGSCLELGANPYFTTWLLDHHSRLELTLANYFGGKGAKSQTLSYVPAGGGERVQTVYDSVLFNVEEDRFPFDDASFDVVLFCEMLEHLLMDPVAVLAEIHRVLKPDGVLVLTTPNVCRLENVLAMILGTNIFHPYSGFGPYGRHNREYIRHEVHRLLDFAGFDVEYSLTADGHAVDLSGWPRDEVAPLLEWRKPDLGQYLFVRARASRPVRAGRPSFLYQSLPEEEIVEWR